jgi:transposase
MPYADTEAMNAHLVEIAKAVTPGAHAILIVDGAGWHGSDALVVPDTISLLKLPPYAPELNPLENVWAFLRANKLANRLYDTYQAIVDACCEAWSDFIKAPNLVKSITDRSWARVS